MPSLPRVGDRFGRYRIDAQIGRGGMGVVYRATDTGIDRTVALKVVATVLGDDEEFLRRFEREAAVLARLDSPHVIAIFDYGSHDGCPYIATQHVGGGDLGALLQTRGPMPPRLALRVAAQVADALHDAHRVGVVHRDIKPSNVLLRDPDTVDLHAYLCDFGIARTATDGLTAPGAVAGTWSYLAPECGRGATGTPASDVYALGCLVWATLTGAPPYRGSDVEIAVAHQRAPVPQLEVPPREGEAAVRINEILRRCLAKDPAERYASADAARTALLAAAGLPDSGVRPVAVPADQRPTEVGSASSSPQHLSLGALAPRSGPPTPTPGGHAHAGRSARRRSALLIGAVCLAVVALAGGVVAVTAIGGDEPAVTGPTADPAPQPATQGTEGTEGTEGTGSPGTPTTGPGTTPTVPERVDDGGPITGDVDGDGLGDLVVEYDFSTGESPSRASVTTWHSDGGRFTDEDEVTDRRTRDEVYRTQLLGDFDGDEILETIALEQYDDEAGGEREVGVAGELSGGTVLEERVRVSSAPLYYGAVGDMDGNGSDDVVLRGYVEFEEAPTRIEVIRFADGAPRPGRTWGQAPGSFGETEVALGDLDGDGRDDVISSRRTGSFGDDFAYPYTVTVFRSGRAGMRAGVALDLRRDSFSTLPIAADIDGDEVDELLLVDTGSLIGGIQVADWRDGGLQRPRPAGAIRGAGRSVLSAVAVSDVDGDGRDDVVGIVVERPGLARFLVAGSRGARFVTGPFGRWRKEFRAGDSSAALRPLTVDFR